MNLSSQLLSTLAPLGRIRASINTGNPILARLQADARASFAEIGQAVSLSAPAVKRRVRRWSSPKDSSLGLQRTPPLAPP